MKRYSKPAGIVFFLFLIQASIAIGEIEPTQTEFQLRDNWFNEHFDSFPETLEKIQDAGSRWMPGLIVLANNDPVLKNARGDKPLKLGDTEYPKGLYCHAVSKIIVRLPSAGKQFSVLAGLDSNSCEGSVIFSVKVGDEEKFRSEVLRRGMAGVPVEVDLAGAREFILEIEDAGDGISCDQSDWAMARVTLENDEEVWLADLPFRYEEILPKRLLKQPPFSFIYGDTPSDELLLTWSFREKQEKLNDHQIRYTQIYMDPKTGLQLVYALIRYDDFPTLEWTIYLKNTGQKDTPVLSQIQALDTQFASNGSDPFLIHHFEGSHYVAYDYQPLETRLTPDSFKRIATSGGRPTDSSLPYFNLETGRGGVIAVLGWPGQWAANFFCKENNRLRVAAGQEQTHFVLHPEEEIRLPLVVLQFYQGDWIRAQNIWRRWMLAHNLPRPYGRLPQPMVAACTSGIYYEMCNANEENQIFFVDRYAEEKVDLDFWHMDAGWYITKNCWPGTGTWEIDTERFPHGLRAITARAHSHGMQSIVWFEPERVTDDTWLSNTHPEWVLGGKDGGLLNLGNPEAWDWLVNHIDNMIVSQGIDLYRQDFNIEPLGYWRMNDTFNRQGITEIKHLTGYLAFWDELHRRHPNMLIDSCASGGRRNDLETLRRSVPLLRSDYMATALSQQCHTYGIAFWMPYYGTGLPFSNNYRFRSSLCPYNTIGWDMRDRNQDYDTKRKLFYQRKEIAHIYMGDYYPLTEYSLDDNVWMAWQFDRPDLGEGIVQAFRREDNDPSDIERLFKLHGLESDAVYNLTNFDVPGEEQRTGQSLMEEGIKLNLANRPDSAIIHYKKMNR